MGTSSHPIFFLSSPPLQTLFKMKFVFALLVTIVANVLGDDFDTLAETIPGVAGDDYPIFAEVPDTGFACDGQTDGGYYADTEAECQAFHICANDGQGSLTKYSFLCPNGTIFNQNYFICDWWFNVDCSLAEGLYVRNLEVEAERLQYEG